MAETKFDVKQLPIHSVIVYTDRAEIKRTVAAQVNKGSNEIVVYNLAETIDSDSIRVDGLGQATINEVAYQSKLEQKDDRPEDLKDKNQIIAGLEKQIKVLETEKTRIHKRSSVIEGLGNQVRTGPQTLNAKEKNGSFSLLSDEGLDGISKFLALYSKELEQLDAEVFRLEAEIASLHDKLAVARQELNRSQIFGSANTQINRQVSILLEAKEQTDVTLYVSYLVHGASWEPKYDIRAYTKDQVVKITYFGLIRQTTGEDWNEAHFFLSTAKPSVGGNVPTLLTKTVEFKPEPGVKAHRMAKAGMALYDGGMEYDMLGARAFGAAAPQAMAIAQTEVQSGAMSTSYEIQRKSTIPSDGTERKLIVAMFELKPTFEHITIPQAIESVFLRAKLINNSPYLILAGPTSIFVDNNFITKANIASVSPGEEFDCSLGVDAAVKVTYKPCEKFAEKAVGFISKTETTRFKQVIEVKNTHQYPIKVQVEDQLPRSNDEKIKVTLTAPSLPKAAQPDSPVALNDKNNIVWRSDIKAQATENFILQYTIEKPTGSKELAFNEC